MDEETRTQILKENPEIRQVPSCLNESKDASLRVENLSEESKLEVNEERRSGIDSNQKFPIKSSILKKALESLKRSQCQTNSDRDDLISAEEIRIQF